jgi:hypothetical protein
MTIRTEQRNRSRRTAGKFDPSLAIFLVVTVLVVVTVAVWHRLNRPGPPGSTRSVISQAETGLSAFRADFGLYPPSGEGPKRYGYENLGYFLKGPEGRGWGKPAGGDLPFGGSNSSRQFGPYLEGGDSPSDHAIADRFHPSKPILYFRAQAGRAPLFRAADNPIDPTGQTGFAGQAHLQMLACRPSGRWARDDHLLISAGPDRLFGFVVEDPETGDLRPAEPDQHDDAHCDDICNFTH